MNATQIIFRASLATTRGVRSSLLELTLVEDEDFGDEYTVEYQVAGQPVTQEYRGESHAEALKVINQIVADRDLFVAQSARSLAGVQMSEIIPTNVIIGSL